jgi:hypothetical protein
MPDRSDRRRFLTHAAGGATALLGLRWNDVLAAARSAAEAAAQSPPAPFKLLTAAQAADLGAMAARIIPTDATPGAREARVVHFMDAWFGGVGKDDWPVVSRGLAAIRREARGRAPRGTSFAALGQRDQIAALESLERKSPAFFEAVRQATILGMFADPRRGGNAAKAGWKVLGFEDRFTWAPPFGDYDGR